METKTQPQNLAEALAAEVARNQDLLSVYDGLPGGVGAFGAMMIRRDLAQATTAMLSGDVVEMVRVYQTLKENE